MPTKRKIALAKQIHAALLEAGEPLHISKIYEMFPDKPQTTVRGRIYGAISKLFQRVAKGIYAAIDPETGGAVVVLKGDGRAMEYFGPNSVDAIVTDHPWLDKKANVGGSRNFISEYDNCFEYTIEDFRRKAEVLKEGGFLVEVIPAESETNYEYLYKIKKMAEACGLYYYSKVPWKKGNFVANTGRKAKNTEDILFFTKGKARCLRPDVKKTKATGQPAFMSGTAFMLPTEFDVQPPSRTERIHQAEKPVELFEQILQAITLPGEVVVDQFAGSGNLGKAALRTGRIGVLYEILSDNIKKIKQNLSLKTITKLCRDV